MITRRRAARRDLREQLIKLVEEEGKERLALTEPDDWRFHYDPQLVLRESLHRENGGKPRTPEEVAAQPVAWEHDLYLMHQLLKFQRDAQGE